eukprot:6279342-Prymnesium_polylepis.1
MFHPSCVANSRMAARAAVTERGVFLFIPWSGFSASLMSQPRASHASSALASRWSSSATRTG